MSDSEIIEATPVEMDSVEDALGVNDQIDKRLDLSAGSLIISGEDINKADELSNRELSEKDKQSDLISQLEPALKAYKEKYGIDFNYDTFKDTLQFALTANKKDRDLKRLVDSDLVSNICEIMTIKSILVASYVINTQLVSIQDSCHTNTITLEAMSMIDKIFSWMDKLTQLKEAYKQYDIDKKIDQIKGSSLDGSDDYKNNMKLIEALKLSIENDIKKDN